MSKLPQVKKNLIDRAIEFFAPVTAMNRYKARAGISTYNDKVGFATPGDGRRFMRGIDVDANSPDADAVEKRQGAVALSRDMYMQNSLPVAILRRIKTNVVGTGMKLQSTLDADFLGLTPEQANAWQQAREREFKIYAESKDCDITRTQNFYELQDLAFLTVLLSGDLCVAHPIKPVETLASPVRIRLIEGDLLRNKNDMPTNMMSDEEKSVAGIRTDSDGAPISYTFANFYLGDNLFYENQKWTTINAFDSSGRRQLYHLFLKERPGQTRGMPMLAPVINDLMKLVKLKDAELTAHVVASFFTVFVKDQSGFAAPIAEGFGADATDPLGKKSKTDGDTKFVNMGSGNITYLDDDKDIQIADPRKIADDFNNFYLAFLKEIAGACEISIEQLLLQFTASYSASRGALLEAWKATRARRNWLAINFCQPTYTKWLDEAVASGRVDAPGYFEDPDIRAAWQKTSWVGMGNGQLDPQKETRASVMKINNNLSSHAKEYNMIHDDGDWEGNIRARQSEQSIIDNADLQPVEKTNTLISVDEEEVEATEE